MHRGDAACHQADQDRWEDDPVWHSFPLGNVWKSHEMSREFWKIIQKYEPSCGWEIRWLTKMPLFGRLVHQDLKAPMASCHRRCDDGHHPSAEFSEWL